MSFQLGGNGSSDKLSQRSQVTGVDAVVYLPIAWPAQKHTKMLLFLSLASVIL